MEPGNLVEVPSDDAVLDPRTAGNKDQYVNHSYIPNARLVELDFRGKKIFL